MVSAGFCHLLGEALLQMRGLTGRFPLAPFLCGCGYMLTLVADKIAANAHGGGGHAGCGGHSPRLPAKGPATDSCCAVEVLAGMDIAERGLGGPSRLEKHSSSSEAEVQGLLDRTPPRNGSTSRLALQHSVLAANGSSSQADGQQHLAELGGAKDPGTSGYTRSSFEVMAGGAAAGGGIGGGSSSTLRRVAGLRQDSSDSLGFEGEPPSSPLLAVPSASGGGGGDGGSGASHLRSVSFLTAVLMGVALCFHSLLEGAAMGAQATIGNSFHIFIAIVSHKGLAAYALGSSIVDSQASMQSFWSVVLPFTFASPVGIFIGYVISDIAKGIGAASISALASGTFLYVAFMEVIPKELRDPSHMVPKLIALLTGFGLMSLLAIWAGRRHAGVMQAQPSASKLKLDSLFLQWFSMPETQRLVLELLDDVKHGRRAALAPSLRKGGAPSNQSPQLLSIPQFYFPQLGPQPDTQRAMEERLLGMLSTQPEGLAVDDLKRMLQQILNLPSSLAYPLFHKLAAKGEERVASGALLHWASMHNLCGAPEQRRAFDILRQEHASAVVPEDLRPLLAGILLSHAGLEFLQEAPEFQERYAETVIHRIFYHNNRLGDGRISWREGDLLSSLKEVDEQEDINKVLRHFSYEHFYVVYCKFWDLDTGVMVSAGFCHLLGEALLQMRGLTGRFPLAPFLCGCGYMLTLVADKIAANAHGGGGHAGCGGHSPRLPAKGPATDSCCAVEVLAGMDIAERGLGGPSRLEKHSSSSEAEVQGLLDRTPPRNGSTSRLALQHSVLAANGSSSQADGQQHLAELGGAKDPGTSGYTRSSFEVMAGGAAAGGGIGGGSSSTLRRVAGLRQDSSDSLGFEGEPPSSPLLAVSSASGGGGGGSGASHLRSVSFLTAVLMGVALCFHSLLEGAAMGAQATIGNSFHIFIAIVSHKGLSAYALGSSIVDSQASMQSFWSVVLPFTFASPVGIFIGYVISDIAKGIGAASISALASGTFLYVAFMEVIPKELRDPSHMVPKLIALLTGFGLMSIQKSVSEDGDIWRAAAASGLHLHVTGVSFPLDSGHRHVFRWTADGMKVLELLDDVKHGRRAALAPSLRKGGAPSNQPPLSPRKAGVPHSPVSPSCKPVIPLKLPPSPQLLSIPQFYFPQLGPQPDTQRAMEERLLGMLSTQPEGLAVDDLKRMLQQILNLPSSLAYPLFHKLAAKGEERVASGALLHWASMHNLCGAPEQRRAFDILRQEHASAVVPEDLRPLLAGILLSHAGLEFLQEAPEFQERYAETVIHRIFYHNNRLGDGRVSWREFRRQGRGSSGQGDLLSSLKEVDEQEDINKVLRHFSYEHFYVVYCKFWDLDTGVMVSAGFCHLLGEALLQMRGLTGRFPLAPFLCGCGYMLTLVADKIAANAHGGGGHAGCGGHSPRLPAKGPATDSCCAVEVLAGMDIAERGLGGPSRLEKHSSSSEAEVQGLLDRTPPRNGSTSRLALQHSVLAANGSSSQADGQQHLAELGGAKDPGTSGYTRSSFEVMAGGAAAGGGIGGGSSSTLRRVAGLRQDSSDSLGFEGEPPSSPLLAVSSASGGGGGGSGASHLRSVSFLTAVLMGVALCFHSLLEGAAMGAQATIGNSFHIFIAIVSHKALSAYALGSSIVDSQASMQSFWSVVLPFTFASPVGIFIGYVISDIAKGIGAASISALASGTFLYVAFMEVIPKELRDPSHMAQPSASKLKLDSLFLQWFSMPETQRLVLELLDDVKHGRRAALAPSLRKGGAPSNQPPLSPRKAGVPHSPVSPSCKPVIPLKLPPSPQLLSIPQFYFPQLGPQPDTQRAMEERLLGMLSTQPEGLAVDDLKRMLQQILNLPSSLAYPLFHKLAAKGEERVASGALLHWASMHNLCGAPEQRRAFDILRQEHASAVVPEDLRPLLAGILLSHAGLEFLQEAPEFQERYAETVIHRIFYHNNRLGDGRISWREGDLLSSLKEVDEQEDINKVLRHFSYEHFYVVYCKFWDLDTDHDFRISRDDLLRYGNHSLTYRIVDRIFSQAGRPFHRHTTSNGGEAPGGGGSGGTMTYEDFVYFILSEEDKATDASLDYWFRCCDLDGDGRLTPDELLYFYEEQLHRMECLSQESVSFDDIMAQMQDMVGPQDPSYFTLHDLKRSRPLAGTLFNVLFNLSKFMAYETRDPFVTRQEREDGLTEWDRFARTEYLRLAMEEDADNDNASDGAWSRLDAL
ncbi:putative serine/threonine protein phosphatase 2A regulatory subunit B''gamma [Chlorella vulgaris]